MPICLFLSHLVTAVSLTYTIFHVYAWMGFGRREADQTALVSVLVSVSYHHNTAGGQNEMSINGCSGEVAYDTKSEFAARQRIACMQVSVWRRRTISSTTMWIQTNEIVARTENIAKNGKTNRLGPSMAAISAYCHTDVVFIISFAPTTSAACVDAYVCVCHFRFHIIPSATEIHIFALLPKTQYYAIIVPHRTKYYNFIIFRILCFVAPHCVLGVVCAGVSGPLSASVELHLFSHLFRWDSHSQTPLPAMIAFATRLDHFHAIDLFLFKFNYWAVRRPRCSIKVVTGNRVGFPIIFIYTFHIKSTRCMSARFRLIVFCQNHQFHSFPCAGRRAHSAKNKKLKKCLQRYV